MARRRRTNRRRKQRGGRIIGKGMQGIAFSPPLECVEGPPNAIKNMGRASPFTKTRKSYVSKIAKAETAATELAAAEQLRKVVDPFSRFTAPALAACKAAPAEMQKDPDYTAALPEITEKGYDTLIFSRYRGESILNIFERADTLTPEEVENILVALCNLLENVALRVNAAAGLLHYDAHAGNVVYDAAAKEATLIDFGFARPLDDATRDALQAGDTSVAATYDITKIHNDLILQFFMFGKDTVSAELLTVPLLRDWFQRAKQMRRNAATSQQQYLDSAKELAHILVRKEYHESEAMEKQQKRLAKNVIRTIGTASLNSGSL
jgi:hypothetical protein